MEGATLWIAWLSLWIACGLFAAGAASDLRRRTVPNAIPLLLLALFAVHAVAAPSILTGPPWEHLAVGAALLAAGFALYCTGRFGAGDAKLVAAAGLWAGPGDLSLYLLGLGVCAFALCVAAFLPFDRLRRMRSELPFAAAIAPPALAVMLPRAFSPELVSALP